jgi:hypothetical protein
MYLVNTRLDSCHAMNVLSHFMSQTETDSLDNNKTGIKIYLRHSWIWPQTCLQCELEFVGYANSK